MFFCSRFVSPCGWFVSLCGHFTDCAPLVWNRIILSKCFISELVVVKKHHLQLDGGRDDHTLSQVSDSEHEGRTTISRSDDGTSGEDERLCPAVGLRRLHEHAAEHHSVDDQPHDILDDQHSDGQRTLLRHHPATKADGHLQQKGRSHQTHGYSWMSQRDRLRLSPGLR